MYLSRINKYLSKETNNIEQNKKTSKVVISGIISILS